jgi:hypothetical protein
MISRRRLERVSPGQRVRDRAKRQDACDQADATGQTGPQPGSSVVPLVFGYMMAAKVGTGIVAELGSMRISDEIDALEVMGISGMLGTQLFWGANPRAPIGG